MIPVAGVGVDGAVVTGPEEARGSRWGTVAFQRLANGAGRKSRELALMGSVGTLERIIPL